MIDSSPPDVLREGIWRPLDRVDAVVLALTLGVAAALVIPRVIWGPCYGDPGEVQLTAAVGGVGHPPGQAGIISIMRLLCLASPLPPHVTVSGATAVFALGTVAILMVCMLRTGAHALAAGLCALLFLADDQFWHAATTPETYATCFILLAGAVWAFLSWVHDRRAWRLWLAVLLYVFLVVNRAPTITLSVCFVAVMLHHDGARREWARHPVRNVLGVAVVGVICIGLVAGSLWLRDVPGAVYNYLDQAYASLPDYPPGNERAADKIQRLWWLLSARQYNYMFHPTWQTVRGQAHWLLVELGLLRWPIMVAAFALIVTGVASLRSRNRSVALFVALMIPATVAPVLLIRVVSHTTLLPNLLFALSWLLALGLSRLMRVIRSTIWQAAVLTAVCLTAWWTADASFLRKEVENDATPFIQAVDLESLPANATLITLDVIPLVYTQAVAGVRPDVTILLHHGRLNRRFLQTLDGPLFTTRALPPDSGAELIGAGPVKRIRLLDAPRTDR